ncbi:MAG: hypothetical protein IT410_00210 [Candidatus Doudnabacteria bacterium]|nr:hypothetical protein [Candidatus Doudnabacteria bacterium]
MSGVMDDCEIARERARGLVVDLSKIDPNNELLRFCRFVLSKEDKLYFCKEDDWYAGKEEVYSTFLTDEDRKRWSKGHIDRYLIERCATAMENYVRALEDMIRELEKHL